MVTDVAHGLYLESLATPDPWRDLEDTVLDHRGRLLFTGHPETTPAGDEAYGTAEDAELICWLRNGWLTTAREIQELRAEVAAWRVAFPGAPPGEARTSAEAARRVLRAVLLFHGGGPWDGARAQAWKELVGDYEATTRRLCDAARAVLGDR